MKRHVLNKFGFPGVAFVATVGFSVIFASNAFAQLAAPAVPAAPGVPAPTAEVGRVICDRFEHSHRGRDWAESSGHISATGHRETGHPQCHRSARVHPPGKRAAG